jgi:assimilatory nitrate reductase catalytic subunit
MAPQPVVEVHPSLARRFALSNGDEVAVVTRRGKARFVVRVTDGAQRDVLFVPFHWGGERSANRLTNPALDPSSRMPEFKVCAARLEPVRGEGGAP